MGRSFTHHASFWREDSFYSSSFSLKMFHPFLLACLLLPCCPWPVTCSRLTFTATDRLSGQQVRCGFCPPGTFLRSRCSSAAQSQCAACPPGSYTAVWNYIDRCLPCRVCGRNQLVRQECTASSDCRCACRPGFYPREGDGKCLRHRECPPGHGVLAPGTAEKDTVCFFCPAGSFSDVSSAHLNCSQHKSCSAKGTRLVLKGASWHDNVCANTGELKGGAEYLREIVPAFFRHHKIKLKRLRRIVHRLPSEGDGGALPALGASGLRARISSWVSSVAAEDVGKLPSILTEAKAHGAAEKLRKKLERIDANLSKLGT